MNHFSLNLPPSDTLWYTPMDHHHHPHKPKSFPLFYSLNHFTQNDDDSQNDDYAAVSAATNDTRSETASSHSGQHSDSSEHMFEKPLTPSDVGKLNRLVIPKQHAEKHFPLAGVSSGSGDGSGATGLLLGFEDETGKSWRFRYSYWNSSQSYVLTKGWSRYVKEKKLDAGDVVLFERHRFEPDRFFIGWRRRGSNAPVRAPARALGEEFGGWTGGGQRSSLYNNAVQIRQGYPVPQPQPQQIATSPFPFQVADCFHAGTEIRQQNQTPPRSGGGNSRRLRLFGVNLECQLEDDDDAEPQTSDGSSLSSQGPVHGSVSGSATGSGSGSGPMAYNYFDYVGYPPNHSHNDMDINFPQDVNQMGNRLG